MITYTIRKHYPNCVNAYGATLGQEHMEPLQEMIRQRLCGEGGRQVMPTETVLLDFSGIESTSASYLKALVLPLLTYREPTPSEKAGRSDSTFDLPQGIFPLVTGLTQEVREELEEVLRARSLPCLEALDWSQDRVCCAHLLGGMESVLVTTFLLLIREKAASATQLYCKYQGEQITITGWNNRLADLHRLRLATRRKEGRQWIYEPITAEVDNG